VYEKYSMDNDFTDVWDLILNSDRVLQRRVSLVRNRMKNLEELRLLKTVKYFLKKFLRPQSLPTTVSELSNEMKAMNISLPKLELEQATTLVSKLMPYESW
jgi:hypothetical protein